MELSNLHFISWEKFHSSSFSLAKKIKNSNEKFDTIVAISRGGLVLARILSDFLDLPIFNIAIESYTDINKAKEPRVTQDIGSAEIIGKKILLVDEICDSGKTFERGFSYLSSVVGEGLRPSQTPRSAWSDRSSDLSLRRIKSACLVLKSHSSFKPDFHEEIIDKWVVFPYEVGETVTSLRDKFKTEDFIKLGFNEQMIEEIFNF